MSEEATLQRFYDSGEYSASEEAIFLAAANEIRRLKATLAKLRPLREAAARFDKSTWGVQYLLDACRQANREAPLT